MVECYNRRQSILATSVGGLTLRSANDILALQIGGMTIQLAALQSALEQREDMLLLAYKNLQNTLGDNPPAIPDPEYVRWAASNKGVKND